MTNSIQQQKKKQKQKQKTSSLVTVAKEENGGRFRGLEVFLARMKNP